MSAERAVGSTAVEGGRSRAAATCARAATDARDGLPRVLVSRPRLLGPLVSQARPVAVIVAPAGYGKTTLLTQWRAVDPRPFASVSSGTVGDDPDSLARAISAALPADGPRSLRRARAATVDDLVPMLAHLPATVIAIDDVDSLRGDGANEVLGRLAAALAPGCTLALVGRWDPRLSLGRLRAHGDLVEVRADGLAMTRAETAEMWARVGARGGPDGAARAFEHTRGWPAMLVLAARAAAEGVAGLTALGGVDAAVREYLDEEVLAPLAARDRDLLRRTAVLDRLSGRACDAALDTEGSAVALRRIARASVPLTSVDRSGLEYVLHPLVRAHLQTELGLLEPGVEREVHVRLSVWHGEQGEPERAVDHAVAAHEAARAGELLDDLAVGLVTDGRGDRLDAWLRALGDDVLAVHPPLAACTALSRLFRGERETSEQWATIAAMAPRGASVATDVVPPLVRAMSARKGTEHMIADARRAARAAPAHGPWHALACFVEGAGHALAGHRDDAIALLDGGARSAVVAAPLVRALCLAFLAFIETDSKDVAHAADLAARARSAAGSGRVDALPLTALVHAATALVAAREGRHDTARVDLREASVRLAELSDAPPWFAALVRIALARTQLRLSDAREARRLLSDAARLRRQVGEAPALQGWLDEGWDLADAYAAGPVACPTTLTLAELRVLRLLPSHLTLREIAERLHVSANTVKTQAHAVYRKLDASSRSEAVEHAAAIGLIGA